MISILVVEDDTKFNQIIRAYLSNNGYTVQGCRSPRESYDLLYDQNFNLIISDIMMPEVDGFEFANTVLSTDKSVPILFATARDDIASKQRGFRLGIDDYMVKPINMDELLL